MGLASPVRVQYPEPFITYTLATGGGVNPYTGLDRFGRVIDLPWFDSESTLVRLNYGYDRASNRTFRKDVVAASHDKRFSELYEYDGVQRLKKFHRGELVDGDSVITAPTLQQGWQLDATGNWVNFTQGNPATPAEALDQQRAHNTVNEITDIARTVGANWVAPQHDRNGNTTLLPRPHDPTAGYTTTWDAWNRMVTVSDTSGVVQTNTYDGLVRRIFQATASGTERYLYTASWQTLEEHTGSPAGLKRRYLWGLRYIDDLVLQDRDPTGTNSLTQRSYALQDALFNVVALAQPNALIRERYAYTAYGRPLFLDADFEPREVQESVADERYLFTGRRLDAATELYYYRMRFYDWGLGRFLGRDPLGYVAGLGLFVYGNSNPTHTIDPIGTLNLDDSIYVRGAFINYQYLTWDQPYGKWSHQIELDCDENGKLEVDLHTPPAVVEYPDQMPLHKVDWKVKQNGSVAKLVATISFQYQKTPVDLLTSTGGGAAVGGAIGSAGGPKSMAAGAAIGGGAGAVWAGGYMLFREGDMQASANLFVHVECRCPLREWFPRWWLAVSAIVGDGQGVRGLEPIRFGNVAQTGDGYLAAQLKQLGHSTIIATLPNRGLTDAYFDSWF